MRARYTLKIEKQIRFKRILNFTPWFYYSFSVFFSYSKYIISMETRLFNEKLYSLKYKTLRGMNCGRVVQYTVTAKNNEKGKEKYVTFVSYKRQSWRGRSVLIFKCWSKERILSTLRWILMLTKSDFEYPDIKKKIKRCQLQ